MERPKRFFLDEETELALAPFGAARSDDRGSPNAVAQRTTALRLYERGQHAEAEVCLRSARAAARRDELGELAAGIALDLARIVFHRSPGEAVGVLRGLGEGPTPPTGSVRYHNLLGMILFELCDPGLADRHFRLALEIAAHRGDDRAVGYVLANRGGNLLEMGRVREGIGLHRQALERLDGESDAVGCGFVLCNMAIVDMLEGRYEEALGHVERARAHDVSAEHDRLGALLDLTEGELELLTGDGSRALGRFASATRRAGRAGLPAIQAKALVWKALAEGAAGAALLGDIEAAGRDLHGRGLRIDAGALYLIGACCAERWGGAPLRLEAVATATLPREGLTRWLPGHFGRMFDAARPRPRRSSRVESLPRFLTRSPDVLALKETLRRLADTDIRILVEGESGAGKSYLARLIHEASRRRSAAFVVVDCTNLDENLFESKLFGHVRGAFTGAVTDAIGLVEQADRGTLFLDEIGEMPVEIQAKLLYTIEERRYRPVGSRVEKTASFRVIAATNRDVDEMVERGELRSDLYYRIAGFRVRLPPLRKRREDIVPLVEHRLARLNRRYGRRKTLRPGVWEALACHDWPGNVRELNATLERGFHLATGRRIGLADLGLGISPSALDASDLSWYAVRRSHLLRVLRLCQGNVSRAARLLGLNRTTLIYKLKLLDIDRSDFDPGSPAESDPDSGPSLRVVADRGGRRTRD